MSVIIQLSDGKELEFNPSIRTISTTLGAAKPGDKIRLASISDTFIYFIYIYHQIPTPEKIVGEIKKTTFIDVFGPNFGTLLNRFCYQPNFDQEHSKEFENMEQRNYASLTMLKQYHKDAEYLGMQHLADLLVAAMAVIVMRIAGPEKLQQMLQ